MTMAVSSTSGVLASPGLGSGLDINGIVGKLMSVESQPLTALAAKEASYQARITAFGTLKGGLSALQTALSGLLDARTMKTTTASLADASLASVAAGSAAVSGSYSVKVSLLAQAHKIASRGFASINDAVGSGTLTFSFGAFDGALFTANADAPSRTVTIAPSQNTLAGIRDAVNAANIGVSATIVNDGSSSGNHLVFSSVATGAANSLKLAVADGDATHTDMTGLSQLAYDPAALYGFGKNMEQKVAAQNASLVIDGIAISKASNTVTDAIQGVTLNLAKASPDSTTTLTIATDSTSISKSVAGFVKAYNDLAASIAGLTKYDVANKKAAILTGDSAPRIAQSQLRSILGTALTGTGLSLTSLSQVGVSFKADGTLTLDSARLSAAITSDASSVSRVFAAMGSATDSLVTVTATGAKAVPGTYPLVVSQLATQGKAVGSLTAGLTITAGVNDTLRVVIDGTAADVTIAAGSYATAAALAAELQSKINGNAALSADGARVSVTESAGVLSLTSAMYGSESTVVVAGNAATGLFGVPTGNAGLDVAGTIGGFSALGNGQTLSADGGESDGLKLSITGGNTGPRGDVVYTQGFAWKLDQALTSLLGSEGVVTANTNGISKRIQDIADRREALQTRLEKIQANYLAQFRALDQLLSSMSTTSSYLTQQLANLPGSANSNK
jgi:flagellar hook-associated protein 2